MTVVEGDITAADEASADEASADEAPTDEELETILNTLIISAPVPVKFSLNSRSMTLGECM